MKKILLAFDGKHYSEGALQFAKLLNDKNPILLTGAFLPQVNYANLWSFSGGGLKGTDFVPLLEDSDAVEVKKNIRRFEFFCAANNITFNIHAEYFDFAIPELKKESRFADLLIIGSEIFYGEAGTDSPNEYLMETLHDLKCPVIVVPEKFELPKNNILLYDGTESSLYAIKQFAYLFPEFANNNSLLVYATKTANETIPNEAAMREIVIAHYPNVTVGIEVTPKKLFPVHLSEQKNAIVVSGSFGRSELSMMLRKSFITEVISEHKLPVFIAHK
jgi:hypothetical protein